MNNYYVYFLLDPTNFYLPFYIGKGKETRWQDHLTETIETTLNKRKFYKIEKIRRSGNEPKVLFYAVDLAEDEAYTIEDEQILRFGRKDYDPGGILTNICLGARPPGFNNCQDQEAFRKAVSFACSGEKNGFYGKTHSAISRELIGSAHKGKTISEDQRKLISDAMKMREHTWGSKISESLTGKQKTDEHKRKIGERHKGKVITQEQRKKISEKMSGRKFSPETIEKMKLAAKAREAKKKGLSSED
jgi:hypothetical protein